MTEQTSDFYEKALKAFDAPLPTQEDARRNDTREEGQTNEPIPQQTQPKRRRGRTLLIGVLLVAVCTVLGLLFWPKTQQHEQALRGENRVYGVVLSHDETSIRMIDMQGIIWNVSCAGVELPQLIDDMTMSTLPQWWVFYDGEAQRNPDDASGWCITARTVIDPHRTSVEAELVPEDVIQVCDHILYDVDHDGKTEHVLLCLEDTVRDLTSEDLATDAGFLYEYTMYRYDILRVVVLDQQGETLYSATFTSDRIDAAVYYLVGNMVFCDGAEELRIASPEGEMLTLRVEDGMLRVYNSAGIPVSADDAA